MSAGSRSWWGQYVRVRIGVVGDDAEGCPRREERAASEALRTVLVEALLLVVPRRSFALVVTFRDGWRLGEADLDVVET